jgi:hypothetical protein
MPMQTSVNVSVRGRWSVRIERHLRLSAKRMHYICWWAMIFRIIGPRRYTVRIFVGFLSASSYVFILLDYSSLRARVSSTYPLSLRHAAASPCMELYEVRLYAHLLSLQRSIATSNDRQPFTLSCFRIILFRRQMSTDKHYSITREYTIDRSDKSQYDN